MNNSIKKIALSLLLLFSTVFCFSQTSDLEKVFDKYGSKRHFEKVEYGSQKPLWLNLIAHNTSFVKIITCDAKPTSRKYKKFNKDLEKSTKDFKVIFEVNENHRTLKVGATEKDANGYINFVIINSLSGNEKVIWLYGKTNIKKFIDYLRDNLSLRL